MIVIASSMSRMGAATNVRQPAPKLGNGDACAVSITRRVGCGNKTTSRMPNAASANAEMIPTTTRTPRLVAEDVTELILGLISGNGGIGMRGNLEPLVT